MNFTKGQAEKIVNKFRKSGKKDFKNLDLPSEYLEMYLKTWCVAGLKLVLEGKITEEQLEKYVEE